jgi:7-keto-8-aminopelargonate synthetase-like enzyme
VNIDGMEYDWFRGNGYLGLYDHPQVLQAAAQACLRYGMKSRKRAQAQHACVLEAERAACDFFEAQAALFLPAGFLSNAVWLEALGGRFQRIFIDQYAHLSLRSAVRASGVPAHEFAHLQAQDLALQLRLHLQAGEIPLLCTDAIFPANGKLAPLAQYRDLLRGWPGALMLVDDAHGAGVLGAHGRGSLEHAGLSPGLAHGCLHSLSLSKAFGCHGGLLYGSAEEIALCQSSAVARGASLPPPAVLAAIACALQLARQHAEWRAQLAQHVLHVRHSLHAMGFAIEADSPSPIICLPGAHLAGLAETLMQEERIAVLFQSSDYPGAPAQGALLFTLFAIHTPEQVTHLLQALRRHA